MGAKLIGKIRQPVKVQCQRLKVFEDVFSKGLDCFKLETVDVGELRARSVKVDAYKYFLSLSLLEFQGDFPLFFCPCHSFARIASQPMPKDKHEPIGIILLNRCINDFLWSTQVRADIFPTVNVERYIQLSCYSLDGRI